MPAPLILYGLSRSVYTRIVRLALEEKTVPYVLEAVEIFGPTGVPDEHLERHPFGRIPVLAHGDFWLYETQAICRYIDEIFPGQSLQPESVQARARMSQIIGLLDAYAYRAMVWDVFVQRVRLPRHGHPTDEHVVASALPKIRTALSALTTLQAESPYLSGASLSLADLHAYPMLKYLSLAPEGQAAIAKQPSLIRWLAALSARPSVQRTVTEYE